MIIEIIAIVCVIVCIIILLITNKKTEKYRLLNNLKRLWESDERDDSSDEKPNENTISYEEPEDDIPFGKYSGYLYSRFKIRKARGQLDFGET